MKFKFLIYTNQENYKHKLVIYSFHSYQQKKK